MKWVRGGLAAGLVVGLVVAGVDTAAAARDYRTTVPASASQSLTSITVNGQPTWTQSGGAQNWGGGLEVGQRNAAISAQRAAAVGSTTVTQAGPVGSPAAAGSIRASSGGVAGGGAAVVALTGLAVGYTGANATMSFFGVPEDELGLAGLQQLLGVELPRDPEFVPNGDIAEYEPGFTPTHISTGTATNSDGTAFSGSVVWGRVGVEVPSGTNAPTTFTWAYSGPLLPWGTGMSVLPKATCVYNTPNYIPQMTPPDLAHNANEYVNANPPRQWDGNTGGTSGTISCPGMHPTATTKQLIGVSFRLDLALAGGSTWTVHCQPSISCGKLNYFPPGVSYRPPDQTENPERRWTITAQCPTGPVTVESAPFHETDDSFPAMPSIACPSGAIPTELAVGKKTGGTTQELFTAHTSDGARNFATAYPNCVNTVCALELHRVDQGAKLDCLGADATGCVDWWTDPQRAANYECTYGGTVVAITECAAYASTPAHIAGTSVKNTSGATIQKPGPYADPVTGDAHPDPSGGTGTTSPSTGCPPPFNLTTLVTGYWVYRGTLCALQEAFIPAANVVATEVSTLSGTLSTRPPFSLVAAVGPTITAGVDGWTGACTGLGPDFDPAQLDRLAIPCQPPQSPAFTVLYWLVGSVMVVVTCFYIWQMAVSALGGGGGEA